MTPPLWQKVKVKSLSRVRLFATPWTEAHKAPPSMGFSRQEYWSELPHSDISRDQSLRKYLRFFFFFKISALFGRMDLGLFQYYCV